MDLSMKIKEARKAAGLTQKELAQRISKSFSAVQKYELGITMPPMDVIKDIAAAVGVSISDFTAPDVAWNFPDGAFFFSEPVRDLPQWVPDLDGKIASAGAKVGRDRNEEKDAWYIVYDNKKIPLSESELIALNSNINSYVKFKLEEIKQAKSSDFESLK